MYEPLADCSMHIYSDRAAVLCWIMYMYVIQHFQVEGAYVHACRPICAVIR